MTGSNNKENTVGVTGISTSVYFLDNFKNPPKPYENKHNSISQKHQIMPYKIKISQSVIMETGVYHYKDKKRSSWSNSKLDFGEGKIRN